MDDAALPPEPPDGGRILDEPLSEALSRRYLAYALSTITQRALPDVRDGLKPVQRRLLYAMRLLAARPGDLGQEVGAAVVGDVIGKYHPHGDVAVYDALVRLAQDFVQRYPLVDGQGNFGNIDGDNAAAMRYTECRLTEAAQLLLDGIDEDAVDFRATYDGEEEEPVVLPAGFPNLLANGSTGIAVGMATSIPPHNAAELIDACLMLLDRPDGDHRRADGRRSRARTSRPAASSSSRAQSLLEAYETGRGGVRVRARWTKEDTGRGTWRIVVTEIPYQVKKADLVEQLAGLIETKQAPLLGDVRDEFGRGRPPGARAARPHRRAGGPDGEPVQALRPRDPLPGQHERARRHGRRRGVMGLKAVLQAFLDHRREVLVRRARFRLGKIEQRLHILDGLLIVFLNLDEVIRIVRYEDEPKAKLIERLRARPTSRPTPSSTPACASSPSWRRWRSAASTPSSPRSATASQGMLGSDKKQWKLVGAGPARRAQGARARPRARRRAAARPSPRRRRSTLDAPVEALVAREPITVILSETRLDPRRARPRRRSVGAEVQGGRQRWPSWSRPRPPTSCCSSPPTGASSRWPATSCRRRAGRASRCG